MNETLTVVVPVWDSYVEYLHGALASVPTGACVLVVDNASLVPLGDLPPAAAVLRLPSRVSVGKARNAALACVDTPLVAFLDADDAFLPGAVDTLRRGLRRNTIGVAGRRLNWDPVSGREAQATRMPRPSIVRLSRRRRTFALLNIIVNTFPINTGIWSTDAVRRARGFGDGNMGEDWVLGASLAQLGHVELLDEPTVRHRVQHGSLWRRPHSQRALLTRSRQVRRQIARNPQQPVVSRLIAAAVAPAHYALVLLQTRGGSFTPSAEQ